MTTPDPSLAAIILAAGKGTRMGGDLPKVVHEVAGKPMVCWVVDACQAAGVSQCVVVVGYKRELVEQALAGYEGVRYVEQTEQLGTGHAAMMAEPALGGDQAVKDAFVLAGDGPLIRPATLTSLRQAHRDAGALATLATAVLDDPSGYGRVLRDAEGGFDRIVEQKDCTPQQLATREVNPSYYCFDKEAMFAGLHDIDADNAQGEYYLTDVPGLLKRRGQTVAVVDAVPPEDVLSINTPEQLQAVDTVMRARQGASASGSEARP